MNQPDASRTAPRNATVAPTAPRPKPRVPTRLATLALASLLLGLSFGALALRRDREQPIEFGADRFDGQLAATGETRLEGNFWLRQGSLHIRAERATLYRTDGALVRVVLEGAPAHVEQELDSGGRMQARAQRIDYQITPGLIELGGDAVVSQPEGELTGELLRYDLDSGRIEGGGSGGVRMRIEPKTAAEAG